MHSECWNKRCAVLHNPEFQKKCTIKEIKEIIIEARIGVIENYNNQADAQPISEEIDTIKSMVRWVKGARVFRKNTRKSGQ